MPASAKTAEHSILLIEEYDALAVAIESALKKFAPRHRVHVARSLAEARVLALAHGPGLIILDFDPPHPGALAFFEQMRTALPETRVLLIAARTPRDLPAERVRRRHRSVTPSACRVPTRGAAGTHGTATTDGRQDMPIESKEVGAPPATIRFEQPDGPFEVEADHSQKSTGFHEFETGNDEVTAVATEHSTLFLTGTALTM